MLLVKGRGAAFEDTRDPKAQTMKSSTQHGALSTHREGGLKLQWVARASAWIARITQIRHEPSILRALTARCTGEPET